MQQQRHDQAIAAEPPARGRQSRSPRGSRLSRRALSGPQTVEAYLRASNPPRYMQRLREIETEFQLQRRRLESAYLAVREACGHDADLFARRWRAQAQAWRFHPLNELIAEHNEWFPVEVDLPMDPRSRDYVPIRGASYRRVELGATWILAHLPPDRSAWGCVPDLPRRAPREPL